MATDADAAAVSKKTGKAAKIIGGKIHTLNVGTGVWQEWKHKRDSKGQFAKKAGLPNVNAPSAPKAKPDNKTAANIGSAAGVNLANYKGKTPPKSFKFYSPGYKPKAWHSLKGDNLKTDGKTLWEMKKAGAFDSDYEFWLAAGKLASNYKKKHPNSAATQHHIVNAAFHYEINETGGLSIGAKAYGGDTTPPKTFTHGATKSGIKLTSKHAPPGTLTKYKKTMKGATGAQVWEDDKGDEWLVKGLKQGSSKAYSNSDFAIDLEEAIAKIQNKSGLRSATSHKTMLDGKKVLAQKMFGNVHEPFAGGPDFANMDDADKLELQKHQILDWVISNWDTHTGNFLKDDKGVIGIDKGQAFKFFGKDKLDWDYVPVAPLGGDKLTYSPMWKGYIDGKYELNDFDNPELKNFAQRLQNIPDDDYRELLRPYAEKASAGGHGTVATMSVNTFLDKAVARKNNVLNDFEEFYARAKKERAKKGNGLIDETKAGDDVFNTPPPKVKELKEGDVIKHVSWGDVVVEKVVVFSDTTQHDYAKVKTPDGQVGKITQLNLINGTAKLLAPQQNTGTKNTGTKKGDIGHIIDLGGEEYAVEVVDVSSNGKSVVVSLVSDPEGDWMTFEWDDQIKKWVVKDGDEGDTLDLPDPTDLLGASGFAKTSKLTQNKPQVPNPGPGNKTHEPGSPVTSISELSPGDKVHFQQPTMDGVELVPAEVVEIKSHGSAVVLKDMKNGDPITLYGDSFLEDEGEWPVIWYDPSNEELESTLDLGPSTPSTPAAPAEPNDGVPEGYKIVPHPDDATKFTIQKPNGEYSKSKDNVVKSWDSEADVKASSTMAKYNNMAEAAKQQELNLAKSQMQHAIKEATDAPDNDPATQLKGADAIEYTNLKQKIMAGNHTPEDYVQFKKLKAKLQDSKKAAGAAQIEEDWGDEFGFTSPSVGAAGTSTPSAAPKKGFKEMPKFKLKGGAPPALSAAKGPNAISLGQQLWEMKKSGQIADDYQMWSKAKTLANKDKKAALAKNPDAQVGVDYSSANALRNVAMRLEFDETGDVAWSSAEEKTSSTIGQTVKEVKKAIRLQEHKPIVPASAGHYHSPHFNAFSSSHFDSSAPAGSYVNPHSFKIGDTKNIQEYGYKYTDHSGWDPTQKSAWYGFTGSGSGQINTFFRTGDVGMYGNPVEVKKRAKAIVDAFKSKNVKPLDDWTTVTRGTSGGWELGIPSDAVSISEMQAKVGKVVRNKCPVSSSLRDKPPWGSYRITYKLPPGFPMMALLGKSSHPGEAEVLLPPGMAYRILEVKSGAGTGYNHEVLVEVVDVKLPDIED
jgi:hypothetical protein